MPKMSKKPVKLAKPPKKARGDVESHRYDHRQRNNLKRGSRAAY